MNKKIVLTGGACAGKTESLKYIKDYFTIKGYNVYTVSEMATILIPGGITAQKLEERIFKSWLLICN